MQGKTQCIISIKHALKLSSPLLLRTQSQQYAKPYGTRQHMRASVGNHRQWDSDYRQKPYLHSYIHKKMYGGKQHKSESKKQSEIMAACNTDAQRTVPKNSKTCEQYKTGQ